MWSSPVLFFDLYFSADRLHNRIHICFPRLIATAGPVVAEAMFVNREEVPVYPIYRDPVRLQFIDFIAFPVTYWSFICSSSQVYSVHRYLVSL